MKRTIILLPALVLLVLAMIGCQLAEPSSEEQVDAESVAWLITDPANGLAQEVTDLGSYLFSLGSTQSAATQGSIIETKALGSADARFVSIAMGRDCGEGKRSFSPKGYRPDFGLLIW